MCSSAAAFLFQVPYQVEQIVTQEVPFPVLEIVEKLIERTVRGCAFPSQRFLESWLYMALACPCITCFVGCTPRRWVGGCAGSVCAPLGAAALPGAGDLPRRGQRAGHRGEDHREACAPFPAFPFLSFFPVYVFPSPFFASLPLLRSLCHLSQDGDPVRDEDRGEARGGAL